jgi:hypothetical protein
VLSDGIGPTRLSSFRPRSPGTCNYELESLLPVRCVPRLHRTQRRVIHLCMRVAGCNPSLPAIRAGSCARPRVFTAHSMTDNRAGEAATPRFHVTWTVASHRRRSLQPLKQ